jgi:hypothetical protein
MSDTTPTRRGFLVKALAGGALLAGGGVAGFFATRRQPPAKAPRTLGPEFTYDVERFRQVDPALVHYRRVASRETGLPAVRLLACDPAGTLHVAGGRVLRALLPDGTTRDTTLHSEPHAVAWHAGQCWVAAHNHLLRLDANLRVMARSLPLAGAVFTGLAVTADHLYVADAGNRLLWRCDHDGGQPTALGARDEVRGVPGFVVPSPHLQVQAGADGLLYVNNPGRHRVELYTSTGDLELAWGASGLAIERFCGCCNPVALALLGDGRLVTAEKGLPRVKLYDAHGQFLGVVAPPTDFPENSAVCADLTDCTRGGLEVAAMPDGTVAVLDLVTRQVHLYQRREG